MTTADNITGVLHPDDAIILTGLRVHAHHGVFDFERENGQVFLVDVTVWLDFSASAANDDLGQTLNYGDLATLVTASVAENPVDLIETVAERVAAVVLDQPRAERVEVTIHKPDAPIPVPFQDVAVRIVRSRK